MAIHKLDWSDLSFGDKKPLRDLHATFVAAPREMSTKRLGRLIKAYLPKGPIVLGIAKEPYIDGFAGQPQFRTLQLTDELQRLVMKVNAVSSKRQIVILEYLQRELLYVIEKGRFAKVVFVHGSRLHAWHHQPVYYAVVNAHIDYDMVSPFTDEAEALQYERNIMPEIMKCTPLPDPGSTHTDKELMACAHIAAKRSFDNMFQTGAVLGKRQSTNTAYAFLAASHNTAVPFETYAFLHGASREQHFASLNDQNYYDTVHAEVMMIVSAAKQRLGLKGTSLFVNLLPCPACSRMLAATDIAEVVYAHDHSNGYAVQLLERAGKKVRRLPVATSEEIT
jgi:deoxycytidylate deaminase